MFKFFKSKEWALWAYLGLAAIIGMIYGKVLLDVELNGWFGDFYNMLQKALTKPNSITSDAIVEGTLGFAKIAGIYMIVAVVLDFVGRHFTFRWRTSMHNYYISKWDKVRHIEGASQRVQEDCSRFSRIVEDLGVDLIKSVLTLIAFIPLLYGLSKHIKEVPFFGAIDHSIVILAIAFPIITTIVIAIVGRKLPGIEYDNQKREAALRKELVYREDDSERMDEDVMNSLYDNVRKNYYKMYYEYLKLSGAKWTFLQFGEILPYIVMAPSIAAGAITLGVVNQISRSFDKVEESFQYLVKSYGSIVELVSIRKRLVEFENEIEKAS